MKQDIISDLKTRIFFLEKQLAEGGYTDTIFFQDWKNGATYFNALNYPALKKYLMAEGGSYIDELFDMVEANNLDNEFMAYVHAEFPDTNGQYSSLTDLKDYFLIHTEDVKDYLESHYLDM